MHVSSRSDQPRAPHSKMMILRGGMLTVGVRPGDGRRLMPVNPPPKMVLRGSMLSAASPGDSRRLMPIDPPPMMDMMMMKDVEPEEKRSQPRKKKPTKPSGD